MEQRKMELRKKRAQETMIRREKVLQVRIKMIGARREGVIVFF